MSNSRLDIKHSSAALPCLRVAAACAAGLAKIEAGMEKEREALILGEMRGGFLRRPRTREEALRRLCDGPAVGISEWDVAFIRYCAQRDALSSLRNLADAAVETGEEKIVVSRKDFDSMSSWWGTSI